MLIWDKRRINCDSWGNGLTSAISYSNLSSIREVQYEESN